MKTNVLTCKLIKLLSLFILFFIFNNFTVKAQMPIIITSPTTSDNWLVGSTHNIVWTASTISGTVDIYYSTDGGSSYTLIQSAVGYFSMGGSYSWTLTGMSPSSNCKIRIVESGYSWYSNTFSISPAGSLSASPGYLSAYDFALNSEKTLPVTISNSYGVDKQITSMSLVPYSPNYLNQTYTIVQSAPITVPAGGSVQVDVKIKAQNTGSFSTDFVINTNGSGADAVITVPIYGMVVNGYLVINRTAIDFGNLPLGSSQKFETVTYTNTGTTSIYFSQKKLGSSGPSLAMSKIKFPVGAFTMQDQIDSNTISPGSSKNIIIGFNPINAGDFSDVLITQNNSVNLPNLQIPIHAAAIQPASIEINKQSINFSSSGYKTASKDSTITIQNTSAQTDLYINSITFQNTLLKKDLGGKSGNLVDPDNVFQVLETLPFSVPINSSKTITIRFIPSKTGTYAKTMHILNSSGNNPDATIYLAGTVMGSTILVTPKNIDYGNIGLGSDSKDTIISITNTGSYILNISYVSPNDSGYVIIGENPSGGIDINPGETYTGIKVRLLPNKLGSKTDTLTILNNASNSTSEKILLTRNVVPTNLTCTPTSLDFGTTSIGTPSVSKTLAITNNTFTSASIIIKTKTISGDTISFYFTRNLQNITLAPGQTDSVKIEFFPRSSGLRTAILRVSSTDPLGANQYITLSGTGGGKPVLFSSLSSIDFGSATTGQDKDSAFIIRNDGNLDLNISTRSIVGDDKNYFSILKGSSPITLQRLQSDTVKIRLTGVLPIGTKTAQYQILSDDASNSAYNIGLSAIIKAPVLIKYLSYVFFDSVAIGTYHDTSIIIKNTGNADLNINTIYFDGPGGSDFSSFGISSGTILLPNEEKHLTIRFTPSDKSNRDARMVILSNDPANPEISINMRGIGKGVSKPVILVSKTLLNFGYLSPTDNKTSSFIIKNIGNITLTVDSLTIAGLNADLFIVKSPVTFPINISPMDSSGVTITCNGSPSVQNPAAKIRIRSNDPATPLTEVTLSATSQKPAMTIDSTLLFASISVNDSTQKELNISNKSSVFFTIDTIYFDPSTDNPFKIAIQKFPIQVDEGGKYPLTVKFVPKSAKRYTSYLNIKSSNAANSPFRVKISGNTNKPVISISSTSIDFGNVELNNFRDTNIAIGNSGQTDLRIDSASFSGPNANLFQYVGIALPISINPSGFSNLAIRFSPGANRSSALSSLRILNNDQDRPVVAVALSGTGDSPTITADTIINFGQVIILDSLKKDLIISNASSVKLRIDSISLTSNTDNSFSFTQIKVPFIIAPKGSLTIKVNFNPKFSKGYQAYLNIYSSDQSKFPLRTRLIGSTTSPLMTITKPILLGKLKTGLSKTVKVSIGNSGDAYLLINNIALTGKDTAEFKLLSKSLPIRIEPDKGDSIFVQFNPKVVGKKDIKLFILSNDPGSAGEIMIDAEGITQNLAVDPSSINYGDVTFSKTKIDSIILQNQGSENITVNSLVLTGSNINQFSFVGINPAAAFTLIPGSKKVVQIEFRPDSTGIKQASLEISSTDIANPKATIILSGNCLSPVISAPSAVMNFSNVRVGSFKDSLFIFTNTGKGILIIKSISMSGKDSADFTILKSKVGKEIPPGQTDSVYVHFSPGSIGDKSATLIIKSNDFTNPILNIAYTGKGIIPKLSTSLSKIDMGKLFVIRTKDTTFSITNDGSDRLLLKNIYISGVDSNKFQISSLRYPVLQNIILTPGETQILQIRFAPLTTGIKNAGISIESDDPSLPLTGITLNGEGFIPSIIVDNNLIADENTDKVINFHLTDDFTPKKVYVYYRKGGSINYDSAAITTSKSILAANILNYTYTFNKSIITKNGLDFYIKISWDGAISSNPQTNYAANPLSLQVKIPVISSAFQLITKSYSMITIPLQFMGTSLLSEIIRNLGTINSSSWRIFKYRNNDYEEYVDEAGWQIKAGDGFWLIAKENKAINFQKCLSIPTNAPFTIRLQPGWNQIGSPFLYDIPFSNLNIPSGKNVENVLWGWNGNDGYSSVTTTLSPWVGYFIKNNEIDTVSISFSPMASPLLLKVADFPETAFGQNEWKISVQTNIGERINNSAELGILRTSADTWDKNDISEPPRIQAKYFSVRFPHYEWNKYKGNYVKDYKAICQPGNTWNMEIMNLTDTKEGEINLSTFGNFPCSYIISVFDYDLNKSFKIKNSYKFVFKDGQEIKKLRLLIGTEEFIESDKAGDNKPETFKLSQNYPNPFNPSTRISYNLPAKCFVTLKIFNMMGREVSTLVSEYQSAGSYNAEWIAIGVPSGIYYYRMQAGNFSDTKKLVFLK